MPVSRTSSRNAPQHPPPAMRKDMDIIEISSDEDEQPPPPRKAPVKKPYAKPTSRSATRARASPSANVIEVKSDEDRPQTRASSDAVAELQRQIDRLKKENESLRRSHSQASVGQREHKRVDPASAAAQRNAAEAVKAKKVLVESIEESVCCEICTLPMWTPYTLPCCGHTFCQSCLQDWFSTIQMKHMTDHPGYNPNPAIPAHYRHFLSHPHTTPQQRAHIRREIQIIYDSVVHPEYTCPICRKQVRSKPVECFPLKSVLEAITKAKGEAHEAKHERRARQDDPFGGFFPEQKL